MKRITESDIPAIIASDEWMMEVLKAAESLNLPDWWIGAGFLRNKLWNYIEEIPPSPSRDVDLVYYNADDATPEADWRYDEQMLEQFPFAEWEVRNQARMHVKNGLPPFTSTADGISHWVETATCIAVKLVDGELRFLYCYGLDDVVNLVARPIPQRESAKIRKLFMQRITEKRWRERWPDLTVIDE